MPVIIFEGTKLTKDQKEKLVKELTKVAADIMEKPQEVFSVLLKENELDNIGAGGKLLSDIQNQ